MTSSRLHRRRPLPSALSSALAILLASDYALAQPTGLEEVVVTAQKREESLQDTPISITAFDAGKLAEIGAYDLSDVGQYAPNVTLLNSPGSTSTLNLTVRGIRAQEPSLAIDSKIGIYIDGVYIARISGALFDVTELERIEVLRGPQGTLWGRNTTGGALNVITAKPSGEFGFRQQLSFGNLDYYRTSTSVDTPEWAGLSAKLTYTKSERDGYIDNDSNAPTTASEDPAYEDNEAYRLALRWQPTDNLTADYAYDRFEGISVPRGQQMTAINSDLAASPVAFNAATSSIVSNPYAEAAPAVTTKRRDDLTLDFANEDELILEGHALTVSYLLGNVELKSITAYRDYERTDIGNDIDGGAYSSPLFHATIEETQEQFSQEFQIIGDLPDWGIEYVAGLYYFEEEADVVNPQFLTPVVGSLPSGVPIIFPVSSTLSYTTDNESRAIYGQLGYTPDIAEKRLTFTLGARYTKDEKQATLRSSGFEGDDSWTDFSPSFTVEYMLSEDSNLYAKVTSAYNSGIFNIRSTTQATFNQPADAEEVVNYEAGIKSQWFDNRLRLNAALYRMDYDELQVSQFQASATGATSVLTNAGEARITGAELEIMARPLPELTVDLTYGYTDFEYKEFITSVDQTTGVEVDSADSANEPGPKHTGSLGVQYEIGNWAFGRLVGRADVTYTDDMSAGPFAHPATSTEDHTLVNGRLSLNDMPVANGRLRVSVWGKNLADEEYRVRGIDFGVADGLGFATASYSMPRTYGVDLSYEY